MKKHIKLSSLIMNVFAVIVTSVILIGSTFAWFTDSATSAGNKIQAGTLKVDLELLDKEDGWVSLKNDSQAIFNYDKWEPGYTDVKILKVQNEGSLALQWKAKFVSQTELSALANVIDVYVLSSQTELSYPTDRNLEGYTRVGTVAEFVNTIEATTKGVLPAKEEAYLGIALKMQTTAGNEYQGLDLGGAFDIVIVATQLSSEVDGFGDDYDSGATLDWTPVANANQLRLALANRETNIVLMEDITIDNVFTINDDVKIDGNGHVITRASATALLTADSEMTIYTEKVFEVKAGKSLELNNVIVDGGAIWTGEVDAVLGRGTENAGVKSTSSIIVTEANANVILGEGAIIQNCAGAVAINLGTRIGATLTLNGGEIINNFSDCGAIWGGGHIIINSGKISNNSSSGLAGAIRMVGSCNLTMNGGEISNNKAVTNGGAIYGYGASTYNFLGGEMSNNSASCGGAMYTGDSSVLNVEGDFKIINNTANDVGGLRLSNRTTLNMKGGEISGNVSTNNSSFDGYYGWNPAINFTGGVIADKGTIQGGLTPTVGGTNVTGVIYFDISTNHNTCNLKSDFTAFNFIVAQGSNFANFNFKPTSDYVYTQGDESKLICLNEGYVTYYDQEKGVFRIKEVQA